MHGAAEGAQPVSERYLWSVAAVFVFVRKYCVFGRFGCLESSAWEPPVTHVVPRPLFNVKQARNSHRFRSQSALPVTYAVTLTFDLEPAYWLSRAETLC